MERKEDTREERESEDVVGDGEGEDGIASCEGEVVEGIYSREEEEGGMGEGMDCLDFFHSGCIDEVEGWEGKDNMVDAVFL